MKRLLTFALACFPLLCLGAPSISYTSYFNNTHTYTNSTTAGTNSASRGVFTNGITAGASTFDTVTSTNPIVAPNIVTINNLTDTWTSAGTTYQAIKLDVTDTASAAASSLAMFRRIASGATNAVYDFGKSGTLKVGNTSNPGSVLLQNSTGNGVVQISSAASPFLGLLLGSGGDVSWDTSASLAGTPRTFIRRDSDGVLKVAAEAAGTNIAAILSRRVVLPKTSAYVAVAFDNSKVFSNEGTTALEIITLPPAAAGWSYTFVVQDADGLEVLAVGDDTIRIAGSVTGAAGNIQSTTIGDAVTIVALNATEWVAISYVGTWTVSPP